MSLSLGNGARITEHARLDARNTFGVRATAELLVEVTDTSALPELFGYAMLRDPNLLLLGGGSNLLFAGDPPAAVLALATHGIRVLDDDGNTTMYAPMPGWCGMTSCCGPWVMACRAWRIWR